MKFLINTITSWDEPPRSRHQVSLSIADNPNNFVYFVERSQKGVPKVEILKEDTNLFRIRPHWPVDYRLRYRMPILNEFYQFYLMRKLKRILGPMKNNEWNIINFDFTAIGIKKYFCGCKTIYFCNDDYIGISKKMNPFLIWKYHKKIEEKIVRASNICIGTSDYLYKKLKNINPNSHHTPHGAPTKGIVERKFTNQNKGGKKIIVTYVGFMNPAAFSTNWIKKCHNYSNYEINLIGPENEIVKNSLSKLTNVKFLGEKTGQNLYLELNKANVCIAPYNLNRISKGIMPNKLWLYLALGKPVVITEIPNMKAWNFEKNILFQTKNGSDFADLINLAFMTDTKELFKKRIDIAEANSWESRINEMIELLNSV